MAAVVAVATALTACTDDASGPATTTTSASTSTSTSTSTTAPAAAEFPGVFPFTSAAEVAAYAADSGDGTYLDPAATAADFARLYLGMAPPEVGEYRAGDSRSGEVEIRPEEGGTFVTTVLVRRVGGTGSPWVVIGAAAGRIVLDSPDALEVIASPVTVSGRSSAFEGTVLVQVKEDGMGPGDHLGQEPLIGGSGAELEPFSGPVSFRSPSQAGGAVVVLTHSARDGSVEQASVVRVFFEDVPAG